MAHARARKILQKNRDKYLFIQMYLVKLVDPQWKAAAIRGTSIRIGSVKYYRNHEDASIRDEDEGEGRISLRLRTIDADTFNRVMTHEPTRLTNGWKINANECPILSERHPFNTLVFSCSYADNLSDIAALKAVFGRSGAYFIPDPMHFAYAAADDIHRRLNDWILNNLDRISSNVHHKIGRLNVYPIIRRVMYTDQPKDIIVDAHNATAFDPHAFTLEPHFSKPTRFRPENEVRIVWTASLGAIDDSDVEFISIPHEYMDIALPESRFTALPKPVKGERLVNRFGDKLSLTILSQG